MSRATLSRWIKFHVSSGVFLGFAVLGSLAQGRFIHPGLPACSQLEDVTTTVTYDRDGIPGWRMPDR